MSVTQRTVQFIVLMIVLAILTFVAVTNVGAAAESPVPDNATAVYTGEEIADVDAAGDFWFVYTLEYGESTGQWFLTLEGNNPDGGAILARTQWEDGSDTWEPFAVMGRHDTPYWALAQWSAQILSGYTWAPAPDTGANPQAIAYYRQFLADTGYVFDHGDGNCGPRYDPYGELPVTQVFTPVVVGPNP